MKKIVLSPHSGSGNHGCEAIVRSTVKIMPEHRFELFSSSVEEDLRYGLDRCCKVFSQTKRLNRFSPGYLRARLSGDTEAFDKLAFAPVINAAKEGDLFMSIGGDNYCYGINRHILLVNRLVRELGRKTVLWGCSIEQDAIDNDSVFEDLSAFDLIVARESITYGALAAKGLKNIALYPDPAFQLERTDLPLPEGFTEGNTVGINLSPMVIGRETRPGAAMANYHNLISHILDTTDMNIALIPHVVWNHNDDRIPLRELHNRFAGTGRVVMVGDYNAEELKGYIARCRFTVAARTHASVAAYSQGVPTLVVGYSVKARGIARDIFGSEENYVIPVQSLDKAVELTEAFRFIYDNEKAIRKHYGSMIGDYNAKAAEAGKEITAI